jgi:hypothetical protein
MKVGQVLSVFAWNLIWRSTGLKSAGQKLVDKLGAPDEEARVIAGMFLVKAGRKAEPLLYEALAKNRHVPIVLTILGDIGHWRAVPELYQYSQNPRPEVAQAAQAALTLVAGRLHGADLSRAYLRRVKLSQADLSGANLSGADLSQADLREANLSGADLCGTNLSGANLDGANLKGASYDQATICTADFDPAEDRPA